MKAEDRGAEVGEGGGEEGSSSLLNIGLFIYVVR